MNKILLFIFLIVLFNSCTKSINLEQEKAAIKTVIEKETNAYLSKNIERRSETFVHDQSVIVLVAGKKNYGYALGFSQIYEGHKQSVKTNPTASTNTFENRDYKIKVYHKSAWAVYDEMLYDSTGTFIEKVINTRFLEKKNGEWKIVYLSHVNTSSYETDNK